MRLRTHVAGVRVQCRVAVPIGGLLVVRRHDAVGGAWGGAGIIAGWRYRRRAIARREQDARVARDPQIVAPEPGKNVPEGQNTKG